MSSNSIQQFLDFLLTEQKTDLRSFYGSNFQYRMNEYIKEENGLAQYGVHYSDVQKWGLNPNTPYFPVGVYFYFLSPTCEAGIGNGFATDRKWANIAKINNERMIILKNGHPYNFDEKKLKIAVNKIRKIYGSQTLMDPSRTEELERSRFTNISGRNVNFMILGELLFRLAEKNPYRFNKLLYEAGYEGIVDYDGTYLPIEGCQGVVTWPTGAKIVESIETPKSHLSRSEPRTSPGSKKRLSNILKGIEKYNNGTLKLSLDEIKEIMRMLPKFHHRWDIAESKMDFIDNILRKLDFNHGDSWSWVINGEFGDKFYMSLEQNPTTPKEFWEGLLHSSDPSARETAKDMLGANESLKNDLPSLFEEIDPALKNKIETAKPNDIITVYHGTPLFRLPLLINGFDSTAEFSRDYRAGKHRGLFVTPDFEIAKNFGGGAIIEINVPAKFIHGTDWSGTIGRETEREKGKEALDWVKSHFPKSFRPYMSYTMLATGEPQGLLIGTVKPSQMPRVWIKQRKENSTEWQEFSRKEFLEKQSIYNVEYGQEKKFKEASIDLANPNIKLKDWLKAYVDSHEHTGHENRVLDYLIRKKLNSTEQDFLSTLQQMDIGGSSLGKLAAVNISKQIEKAGSNKSILTGQRESVSLKTLLKFLIVETKTTTDETIEKALKNWVENREQAPTGPYFFPPKELFKYREYFRKTRPDLLQQIGQEGMKTPIQLMLGLDGNVKIGEGNHRLKTAIQLGLKEVPVTFHFVHYAEKSDIGRDRATMKKDIELARKKSQEAERKSFQKKYKLNVDDNKTEKRVTTPEDEKQIQDLLKLIYGE